MCKVCDTSPEIPFPHRRQFLRLAAIGTGLILTGAIMPTPAQASVLPKPQNDLDPLQALAHLMEGNARYAAGVTQRHNFLSEREALGNGQNPFAAILGCADSRVALEYAFDTGLGDLFAVRVAGNFMTTDGLASLEYAVAELGTPLILVLGHQGCGAVTAGVKALSGDAKFPGHIQSIVDAIEPSVIKAQVQPGDLLDNAISQNVKDTVANLKQASPLLADAIERKKLKIVGGIYKLGSGKVELVA